MIWFDAHLDLACLAVRGRNMTSPVSGPIGPFEPGCVTLPELVTAGVRFALATVFTELVPSDTPSDQITAEQYPAGDVEFASRRGRAQVEAYLTWQDMGLVKIDIPSCLRPDPDVGETRAGMGVSETIPPLLARKARRLAAGPAAPGKPPLLHLGLLVEGADPIRSPDELPWWIERGVCAVGLTWARGSRYAAGNNAEPVPDTTPTGTTGLTHLGRSMVKALDALGVVHDLSHLSQQATEELLELTDAPVIASHSNCRALLGGERDGKNQRHLRDQTIIEIGRRGGVVGLNLFAMFLRADGPFEGDDRPTIDHAADHVDRIAALMGRRTGVALGSDMDGGFSRLAMCRPIEGPTDLPRLADALRARGWTSDDIDGFTHLNWLAFFEKQAARRM